MEPTKESYENLHKDYKKLMSEYEELNEKGKNQDAIQEKLEQLTKKQKEIVTEFSKLNNSPQ